MERVLGVHPNDLIGGRRSRGYQGGEEGENGDAFGNELGEYEEQYQICSNTHKTTQIRDGTSQPSRLGPASREIGPIDVLCD